MSDYVIVSDATLDLPIQILEEYDINVIPMGFDIDGVEFNHYPDEKEISVEAFYGKLKAGATSHTTQITPGVFIEYFTCLLNQGKDILYIAFSSGLSGTYHAAGLVMKDLAEEYPDRKIYIVDSLCASVGEGLLVYHAAMQKKNGLSIDELRNWVEDHKYASRHWFTVRDLHYLKRGGRITSIEAVVGTALRIRPVLGTNEEGKLEVVSKVRGSKAELEFLVSKMETEGTDLASQTVIIGHGDNLEQAVALEKLIRSKNLVKDIIISKIGPIIGTHTGPGMLALVYMGNKGQIKIF
ncbi:DegV family protein [Mobilitalea sibirica]|uniref:DegV family protein n=1 Tax=Mobilitalea sibirica TaxID=1462919 RepID=A0A8J7HCS7_9FIRM|nr:DegV family protein [Mobilitalea sibirica]MBH1941257.1 DegV family protein [Mobilitalea sibirica]